MPTAAPVPGALVATLPSLPSPDSVFLHRAPSPVFPWFLPDRHRKKDSFSGRLELGAVQVGSKGRPGCCWARRTTRLISQSWWSSTLFPPGLSSLQKAMLLPLPPLGLFTDLVEEAAGCFPLSRPLWVWPAIGKALSLSLPLPSEGRQKPAVPGLLALAVLGGAGQDTLLLTFPLPGGWRAHLKSTLSPT